MNVEKPIFVVGAGRSGSTVFHQMFCEHPQVAWLSSRLSSRNPAKADRNGRLMRSIDLPVVGGFLKRRFWPGEAYDFWDYLFPGFFAAVSRSGPRRRDRPREEANCERHRPVADSAAATGHDQNHRLEPDAVSG